MTEKYTLGDLPVPLWCAARLTPFKKLDGSTGYEYYGTRSTYTLSFGDEIIKKGSYIEVIRKGRSK